MISTKSVLTESPTSELMKSYKTSKLVRLSHISFAPVRFYSYRFLMNFMASQDG